jgi:hypothetical protein
MAIKTTHISAIIKQYNQEGCCDRIAILDKAFDIKSVRNWKTKQQCICEAMGYKLENAQDEMYSQPINNSNHG